MLSAFGFHASDNSSNVAASAVEDHFGTPYETPLIMVVS
jgi:hypothetical protein